VPDTIQDFTAILKALNQSKARVVLIGGVAMIAHGSDSATKDIDFAFARDRENLVAIVSALASFSPRPKGFRPEPPFIWDELTLGNSTTLTLTTSVCDVDFLAEPDGAPPFSKLYERGIDISIFGERVRVASAEDLISMKRAAGRERDLYHLRELESLGKLVTDDD
jgi:hypothetical protein